MNVLKIELFKEEKFSGIGGLAMEGGVKFRTIIKGYVAGIHFYQCLLFSL